MVLLPLLLHLVIQFVISGTVGLLRACLAGWYQTGYLQGLLNQSDWHDLYMISELQHEEVSIVTTQQVIELQR